MMAKMSLIGLQHGGEMGARVHTHHADAWEVPTWPTHIYSVDLLQFQPNSSGSTLPFPFHICNSLL